MFRESKFPTQYNWLSQQQLHFLLCFSCRLWLDAISRSNSL